MGDVEEGVGEIINFNWDCLKPTMEVNVHKVKYYKKKLEEDTNIQLLDPLKDTDAQLETIRVQGVIFFPYCLMNLVLDKYLPLERHSCCRNPPSLREICLVVKESYIFVELLEL